MLDYQKIVDDLRSALGWASADSLDMLRLASADYSLACEEANDRLRDCGALLSRGLRSEALQKCEAEPNLLDVVAALDFPEREQLIALTQSYGIAQPPALSLDVAAELNEAYAVQQPLETLLRRHRLLALARGPLVQRIATLRGVAELDQNNAVWQDDLVEFEKERLKQIQQEAQEAVRSGDLATLDTLGAELGQDAWRQPPPAELLRSVRRAADKVGRRDALAELTALEVQLNEAFAAFDVDTGRRLRERWNVCAATYRLAEDDPLAQRAEPALTWLREQDAHGQRESDYQVAIATLEQALDRNSRLEYLEKLHATAVRHGHEVLTYIANRYQSRVETLRLATRRRHRLILASVAAALLLLGASIGTITWRQIQRREVETAQAALRELIDQGKLDAATAYLAHLKEAAPRVADSADVQHQAAALDQLRREDDDRRASLKQALAQAMVDGPEKPNHGALAEARKLARSSSEVQGVREFEVAAATHLRMVQSKRDEEFGRELEVLRGQIGALEKDRDLDERQFELRVRQSRSELLALIARSGLVSQAMLAQHRPLLTRLDTLEDSINRRKQDQSRLEQITRQVGSTKGYQNALTDYIKQFADSPRAADFQRAIEEAPLWEGMERWNKLALAADMGTGDVSPKTATELVKQGKEMLDQCGAFPQVAKFRPRLRQLESVARRVGDDGVAITDKLKKLFSDRLMANVWLVQKKDGTRYYLPEKPGAASTGTIVLPQYYADFSLTTKKTSVLEAHVEFIGEAPQWTIAKKAQAELNRLNAPSGQAQWESCFATILKSIYDEVRLDPVLRIALLKQTVEVAGQGSAVLAGELADVKLKLDESAVNTLAPWMTPGDKDATNAQVAATNELKDQAFIRLSTLPESLVESKDPSPRTRLDEYRWIAWLHRDGRGKWRCSRRGDSAASGDVLVAYQPKPQGPVELKQVGRLDGKEITVEPIHNEILVEGRPVYLRVPASAIKSTSSRRATN